MNHPIALLFHLMKKDLRSSPGLLAALWGTLGLNAAWPWVSGRMPGNGVVIHLAAMLFVMAPFLMAGLFLSWVDLDHPLDEEGFMQTRPVSGAQRAASKMLLWLLAAALPAWGAVMLQMRGWGLDLRWGDYGRVTCVLGLLMLGCHGVMAATVATVRRPRVAMAQSVVLMVLVAMGVNGLSPADFGGLQAAAANLRAADLEASRLMAALCVLGGGGFVIAAWMLARGRARMLDTMLHLDVKKVPGRMVARGGVRTLIAGLAGTALLALAAWLAWPVNVKRRPANEGLVMPMPAAAREARLAELRGATRVEVGKGTLALESHWNVHRGPRLRSSSVGVAGPEGEGVWPQAVGYEVHGQMPSGRTVRGAWNADGTDAVADAEYEAEFRGAGYGRRAYDPPVAPGPLLKLLGLPEELRPELERRYNQWNETVPVRHVRLTLELGPVLKSGHSDTLPVPLAGTIACAWFKPVLAATLPLRFGETFALDGRKVVVRGAGVSEGRLRLEVTVVRHGIPANAAWRNFDMDPQFLLYVANPARGQLAWRQEDSEFEKGGTWAQVSAKEVSAEYEVLGAGGEEVKVDETWIGEARLYVVRREELGVTKQPFSGVFAF